MPKRRAFSPLFFLPLIAAFCAGCLAADAVRGGNGGGSSTSSNTGGGETFSLAWAQAYGINSDNDQRATGLVVDAAGVATAFGSFRGSLTIGTLETLPNTEDDDGFVVQLTPEGTPSALVGFAGQGDQLIHGVGRTPDGGTLVSGSYDGSLLIGGADETGAPEGQDGFIASFNDKLKLRWIKRISGPGSQAVHAVTVSPSGEITIAGTFEGPLTIGDVEMLGETNGEDFFVARLDALGDAVWATSLGADPADLPRMEPVCRLALDAKNNVHVAGTFKGTVQLDENLGAIGTEDIFVGALTPTGSPIWGHTFGAPGKIQRAADISVNATGETLVFGDLRGEVTVGGQTFKSDGVEPDVLLFVFNEKGYFSWGKRYGSVAEDHAGSAQFDGKGNVLLTGRFRGSMSFGDEAPLLSSGAVSPNDDIFLAALNVNGKPLFSTVFGKSGNQVPTGIASPQGGDFLLVGYFDGIVDFGSGELDALDGDDLFLVKLTQ